MKYVNNTNADISMCHAVILEAIRNGGVFREEWRDTFRLTRTPPGSAYDWVLDWA